MNALVILVLMAQQVLAPTTVVPALLPTSLGPPRDVCAFPASGKSLAGRFQVGDYLLEQSRKSCPVRPINQQPIPVPTR